MTDGFHTRQGFTLIELSIVLVIIGLIVGGILAGRDMIRAAELRSVATDVEHFRTAIYTFQSKYNCLPGDCNHATQFWGRADGGADLTQNCAHPDTDIDPAHPTATCNGSGDDMIANSVAGSVDYVNTEMYRFWQHLSNAELIAGQYSGIGDTLNIVSGSRGATLGVNAPKMRFGALNGYLPVFGGLTNMTGWTGNHTPDPANRMWAGAQTADDPPWTPTAFSPEDAQSIDTKVDDGKPGTGTAISYGANANPAPCATGNDTDTASYNSVDSEFVCAMIFKLH